MTVWESLLFSSAGGLALALAASQETTIPLVSGLTMVSVLRYPDGDRENVVTVEQAAGGFRYTWRVREQRTSAPDRVVSFTRLVRTADLLAAPRLNTVFSSRDRAETAGYTAFTLSTAVYDALATGAVVPFANSSLDGPAGVTALGSYAGFFTTRILLNGTLAAVSTRTTSFGVLVNGRRVIVPVLHVHGHFRLRNIEQSSEFWVLADRSHPLLLKIVTGEEVFQVVSVEMPGSGPLLEQAIATGCSAELGGIYFAFGSAELEPESQPAIQAIAAMLVRHTDWTASIEGHTDSIGRPDANQLLSQRRAEAVVAALITSGAAPSRLGAVGRGASRPRESNLTIEGRARNRRVELVRACRPS